MFIKQNKSAQHKPMKTESNFTLAVRGEAMRLMLLAILVVPTMALAGWSLYEIFLPNGLTGIEIAQLGLSLVLFAWLSMAFWTGVIGFVLRLANIDPLSLKKAQPKPDSSTALTKRHAVIMPVYNEDTRRIMVGFEACVRELADTEHGKDFDFYMLSDTQKPDMAEAELKGFQHLKQRLGAYADQVFYRRREKNEGRKVGNVADFCQRWGSHYESMIVLDADSIMTGERMVELAQRIEANDKVALVQTIPMPVRSTTFFGRFVQFAAHLYSPMLATGLSFWQTDSANYWGHNAVIRIAPFMQHCGLPSLPGREPFGGDILSHDFVEAALLRRAGWEAYLLTDTDGSYEEVPAHILEYATRDRRWVQGNIQHLGLLKVKGLTMTNRMHFIFGAFAYMSSLVLMLMLALGTADALDKALTIPEFFGNEYQLFPTWQVARQDMMMWTLWGTTSLLLMPKVLGIILALIQRREEFGGAFTLLKGAVVEIIMAMLLAPLMMFYHSYFVLSVFVGHSVKWEAQDREGKMVPWADAFKRTQVASSLAIAWGVTTWYFTPSLFVWLMPVLIGLALSAPIIRFSSSLKLGHSAFRNGIFVISPERKEGQALKRVRVGMANFDFSKAAAELPVLPEVNWQPMVIQAFNKAPLPAQLPVQSAA